MKILSVEASTESCSAAFCTDDNILVRHQIVPREHSKLLLTMVDELLKEAGIGIQEVDAFAYGMGPGSFTGLRIAASIVQGLAFGSDKVVVPVSTLRALAQAAWRRFGYSQVFAALDARMQEIYFGFYKLDDSNIMQNVDVDRLTTPDCFTGLSADLMAKSWHGVGSGMVTYREILKKSLSCVNMQELLLYPSALEIAILASEIYTVNGGQPATTAIPIYLRNKIAEKQSNTISETLFKK